MLCVAEQEGDVHHAHVRHKVAQCAGGDDGRFHSAQLQTFDQLALAAQRGCRELLELVGTVRAFFHAFAPGVGGCTVVRIDRQRIANLDFLALSKSSAGSQRCSGGHGRGDKSAADHAHGLGLSEMF